MKDEEEKLIWPPSFSLSLFVSQRIHKNVEDHDYEQKKKEF
jgi:hypothetical protein